DQRLRLFSTGTSAPRDVVAPSGAGVIDGRVRPLAQSHSVVSDLGLLSRSIAGLATPVATGRAQVQLATAQDLDSVLMARNGRADQPGMDFLSREFPGAGALHAGGGRYTRKLRLSLPQFEPLHSDRASFRRVCGCVAGQ